MPPPNHEESAVSGGLQVVARSAQILRMFTSIRTAVRINDVAEELRIGRTSAHRYLQSLAAEGFLQRVNESDYQLGPLIIDLAASMAGRLRIVDAAGPVLEQLAIDSGQTAVLGIWSGASAVAVACKEPPGKSVNVTVRIGAPLGPRSAQGRAFLVWGPNSVKERSLAALKQDHVEDGALLEVARTSGFTESSAITDGVAAIAAPVYDRLEQMLATIAVVAPVGVLNTAAGSAHTTALLAAARDLSTSLGSSRAHLGNI